MATIDWSKALDLVQADRNVRTEFRGDWHQDPWGWPEPGSTTEVVHGSGSEHANTLLTWENTA